MGMINLPCRCLMAIVKDIFVLMLLLTLEEDEEEEEEDSCGYSCYVIHLVSLVVRITMMMLCRGYTNQQDKTNSFRIW